MATVKYALYDPSTGRVLQTGKCDRNNLRRLERDNLVAVETTTTVDQIEEKIVGGQVVRKTQAEIDRDNPPEVRPDKGNPEPVALKKDLIPILARLDALENP